MFFSQTGKYVMYFMSCFFCSETGIKNQKRCVIHLKNLYLLLKSSRILLFQLLERIVFKIFLAIIQVRYFVQISKKLLALISKTNSF